MAIYNFYNGYEVDDSNIGCGRILVSECNGMHVYENPCDIMNACIANLPQQLTSQCVVDFLNNLNNENVGDFIRIDSSHCLEAVPLNLIQSDRLVAVDNNDMPGELETKIVGCQDITVNKIGPINNRQLEICYSGPTTFQTLADVPNNIYNSCADESTNAFIGQYLKINPTHNGVEGDCTYKYLGALYLSGNVNIDDSDIGPNDILSFILGGLNNRAIDQGMYITTTSSGAAVVGPSQIGVIRIPVSGIRRVSLKGNVQVNPGIQSIRMFVVSTATETHGCVDCKFGAGDDPKQPMVWRYDKPLNINSDSYVNMGGDTMVYIEEGTYLTLGIKIDSNAGTSIHPRATIWASGITGGTLDQPEGNMNARSGTSIQVEFIRSQNFDEISFA